MSARKCPHGRIVRHAGDTSPFPFACALRCANGPVLSGAEEMAARLSTLPLKRLLRLTELMRAYQEKLERNVNGSLLTAALCMELKREG